MQTLLRLISGADSKTTARVEQYHEVRTSVKSVEITIEREEIIKAEKANRTTSDIYQELIPDHAQGDELIFKKEAKTLGVCSFSPGSKEDVS